MEEHDRAMGGVLFMEAKFILSTMFNSARVLFVPRTCNFSAYDLACLGRSQDPDHPSVWMDPLPSLVIEGQM
jgi:uncharacterized Zn-finger protein